MTGNDQTGHKSHKTLKKVDKRLNHFCIYIKDINECELSRDNCSSKAECLNTEGSFACKCLKGYRGDGVLCIGNELKKAIINPNAEYKHIFIFKKT